MGTMADRITAFSRSSSEDLQGMYSVTIEKGDGTSVEGFINPNSTFGDGRYPVFSSMTANRAEGVVGSVSKDEFARALERDVDKQLERARSETAEPTPLRVDTVREQQPQTSQDYKDNQPAAPTAGTIKEVSIPDNKKTDTPNPPQLSIASLDLAGIDYSVSRTNPEITYRAILKTPDGQEIEGKIIVSSQHGDGKGNYQIYSREYSNGYETIGVVPKEQLEKAVRNYDEREEKEQQKRDNKRDNNLFSSRREVLVDALKTYHAQSHDGETNDQKINALTSSIDKAVASNERLSIDNEKAQVALEWESVIRNTPPDKLNAFLAATKTLASGPTPKLPAIENTNLAALENVTNIADPAVMAVASEALNKGTKIADLSRIVEMNRQFEAAAQKSGLIDYGKGESLTALLDAQDEKITVKQRDKKTEEFMALAKQEKPQPVAAQKPGAQAPQDREQDGGFGGMLGALMETLGPIGLLITAIFSGNLFGGRGEQESRAQGGDAHLTPQQELDRKSIDALKHVAKLDKTDPQERANEHITDTELVTNGKLNMTRVSSVLGFNPDRNNDRVIDPKEMLVVDVRLDDLVKSHPEVKQIAADFKTALNELRKTGTTHEDMQCLPDAKKETGVTRG